MSAPELKPCPFCWNEKIEDWGESTWSQPVKWMYCTECAAQGPRVMLERNEENDAWLHRAITAWNTRADLVPAAPKVKALVEALREAARQHRVIAGMDLIGASSVAYNAARKAEAALAALEEQ